MHFADRTLIRMADPESRGALFTSVVAKRLVIAAFGSVDTLTDPFTATVDRLTLGVASGSELQLRGRLRPPDGPTWDFEAAAAGATAGALFLPAIVEGFLSATAELSTARVASVTTRSGSLPDLATLESTASAAERADPTLFERRRRIELVHRVADSQLADDVADRLGQQWLADARIARVEQLIASGRGPHGVDRLALKFEPLEPGPPAVRTARFVAGVVIDPLAPNDGGLLGMLQRTRELQKLVAAAGRRTEPLAGLEPKYPVPVLWLVPGETFEEDDWPVAPGVAAGDRATGRETRAAGWLAGHGIVLTGVM